MSASRWKLDSAGVSPGMEREGAVAEPQVVEQDLIICRALCDLFAAPELRDKIVFRGGTAINKLLFRRPLRYSEDIDLVQVRPERIGPTIDAIREALAWLGDCNRDRASQSTHLTFRFEPEVDPGTTLNLKVEVNTREHVNLLGLKTYAFELVNGWHRARTEIVSFEPEELFGTKLRALLQRRQGRDLFDLDEGLKQLGLDSNKVIGCFEHYLKLEGHGISRADAEQRMLQKLGSFPHGKSKTARGDLLDGDGLVLRIGPNKASWVLRYTSPSGRRREFGLGKVVRDSLEAAGASLKRARQRAEDATNESRFPHEGGGLISAPTRPSSN